MIGKFPAHIAKCVERHVSFKLETTYFASRNVFSDVVLVFATCSREHVRCRSRARNKSFCDQAVHSTNRFAGACQAQYDRCAGTTRYVEQCFIRQLNWDNNAAPR